MKKKIMITALLCILLIIPSYGYVNGYDSNNLSTDEINKLNISGSKIVVKLYNGTYMYSFSQQQKIDELISEKNVFEEIYMVASDMEGGASGYLKYMVIRDGAVDSGGALLPGGPTFFQYATNPELLFNQESFPEIEIENVYCLDGELSNDGMYIYYITNQGDYIYYKAFPEDEQEYLFPVADFYDLAEAAWAEISSSPNDTISGSLFSDVYDISAYEVGGIMKSKQFDWKYLVFGVVSVGVIASLVVLFIKSRRIKTDEVRKRC